mgnify:CR=1 FL=1
MMLQIERGEDRVISEEGIRAPHVFRLENGTLLLTFHVQADQHFAKRINLRSKDNGETWERMPQRNHREMAWGETAGGKILAYDRDTFEQSPGVYIGAYAVSEDGGETFGRVECCTVFVDGTSSTDYPVSPAHYPPEDHPLRKFFRPLPSFYQPIVQKASVRRGFSFWRYLLEEDGRLITAMQGRFHGDVATRTICVASDDEGKSWHFVSTIAYPHDKRLNGMCEPVMRRVADGSLLCVIRRGPKEPLAQCRSTDGGLTWSEPELLPGHGVDPDLLLMSNGVLACTYGRPGLHIMFSEDGCGYSWGYRTVIGTWGSSAYTGITELSPGKLLLLYDGRKDDTPGAGRDPEKCYIGATTVTVNSVPLPTL